MKNNKRTITASEINRFSYCPYQWYYERLYGRQELSRMAKEKNKPSRVQNSTMGNFKRGLEYHKKEYEMVKFRGRMVKIISISILLVFILFFICFKVMTGV